MARIRVMPETLANKIAAGEVVERPASVVKELVENATDAAARQIVVDLPDSGCRSVRVVDDGIGMEEDDVLLSLERHATSKVYSDEDLRAIHTYGFRGEALPSLAAVSRFELRSRTRESTAGTCVRVSAGVVREVHQCGCPPGTQVWVRDLFFNQPARRKFLKSKRTEFGHVVDTLVRLALARPDVHFALRHKDRLVHDWPAGADMQQRLAQLFPKGFTQSWLPLSYRREPFSLRGFLSSPEQHRSNSRLLLLCVNGRPVKDRLLCAAILKAYQTLLPKGQFPLGVVFVDLPAEMVDINVHPTKAEVRFQDSQDLARAVTNAVRTTLANMEGQRWSRQLAATRDVRLKASPPAEKQTRFFQGNQQWISESHSPTYEAVHAIGVRKSGIGDASQAVEHQRQEHGALFSELAVIGQLHHTYIVCEAPDGLVLIDQHASHERVFFEVLQAEVASGTLASQMLVVPETIEFTAEEAVWLEDSLGMFERLGFGLEPFGSYTFLVRAIPMVVLHHEPLALLRDLVASGVEGTGLPARGVLLEGLLQSMACRMAVKAGKRLGRPEMEALLQQLDGLEHCSTCPHGRPLWWKLTFAEVERIFGRA